VNSDSAPTDKLIGQVLANRYQILHRLGEGAMGVVYKARHVKVGRSFAVKVLHARLLEDPKVALRFDREAELAGRLRHPNVVGVVDVGELDGMRYMVMDFAEGPDLARLLVEAPMPAERIIRLVRQMLEGLYHAHEQGLIHRDFKPENVIIERDTHGAEMPRIVDFGIAILRDGGETTDGQGRLTTNGLVLGTPHYMAPEQAVADPIDHRIDLFALGIVIYEMLSGRLPFDGSGAEVARANLLVDPPPIVQRVPYLEVDPLLEAFARRLMAKKRNARPATAKAARELLDLIDRDRPAAAVALGMATTISGYGPGVTQPVAPQDRSAPFGGPQPPTTRLRATPTPSQPIMPFRPAPPASGWPMRSSGPPSGQPASPPSQPRFESARPGPIAFSAPDQPRASLDHETDIRTPLGWPQARFGDRRRLSLIVGVALGSAGLFVGLMIARPGAKSNKPADEARVAMSPVDSNTGSAPAPAVTAPPRTDPAATASRTTGVGTSDPTASDPAASNPTASDPTASDPAEVKGPGTRVTGIKVPTRHVPPRDTKTHEPKLVVAKAADAKAADAKAADAKAADAKAADAKAHDVKAGVTNTNDDRAVDPRAGTPKASPSGDVTASAVSTLYYSVADQLKKLPDDDQTQKLWVRWRRFSVQTLMLAPQAERNAAAGELSQVLKEARLRIR
jgi:serine/threonine protein kinase